MPTQLEGTRDLLAAADRTTLANLTTTYQNMLDALDAIEATKPALAAHAATLSAITVSGTLAQTQTQLQTVLRSLGTDLGVVVDNVDKLANGSETVLKTLAALKRNLGR